MSPKSRPRCGARHCETSAPCHVGSLSANQTKTVSKRIAAKSHRGTAWILKQLFLLGARAQRSCERPIEVVDMKIHVDGSPMPLITASLIGLREGSRAGALRKQQNLGAVGSNYRHSRIGL